MSTRRADSYQWDHGAQYFSPKSDHFARTVMEWQATGLCEVWDANHCVWDAESGVILDPKSAKAKRYVGIPGMNAICKELLAGIDTHYETRAVSRRNEHGGWTLEHGKTGMALGDFDFVICTDKTAALRHRPDLDKPLLEGFVKPASAVQSHPSLALLVAVKPTSLEFDSLLLDGHPAFSWLARDSSKPGRQREDGVECWVAHAAPSFTQYLLDATREKQARGKRNPKALRSAIVTDLVPQFESLVSELTGGEGAAEVLMAQGHRWGAAFPVAPFDASAADQFYLDKDLAFAACGDYFTPFPGRVEGAWISGSSLADEILSW